MRARAQRLEARGLGKTPSLPSMSLRMFVYISPVQGTYLAIFVVLFRSGCFLEGNL